MSPLDLLKYSEIRFAYTFLMLQRLYKVRVHLRQLVVSAEWDAWRDRYTEAAQEVRTMCLDDEMWDAIAQVLKIVRPIVIMLRLLDGDEPCIGKVYEGLDRMIESIQSIDGLSDHLKEALRALATARWTEYHSSLEAAAFVLDPEFQGKGQETDKEVVQGWEDILRRHVADADDRRKVREELSYYRQKRGLFGMDDAQSDRFKISSARWWEDYGAGTPMLQYLATRILSQGASSSPCERLWSNFGHIASKKRNRLGVEKANDLVFVNANLRLLNKFRDVCKPEPFIGFTFNTEEDDIALPNDDANLGDENVQENVHEDVEENDGEDVVEEDYVDHIIGSRA